MNQMQVNVDDEFINGVTGERYAFKATAASTGGAYVAFENFAPGGLQGPPSHLHPKQTETFTVLEGQLMLTVEGKSIPLGAGESVTVPIGVAHTFNNVWGEDVLFQVRLEPALDSEEFFAGIIKISNESGRAKPSLRQLAKLIYDQESRLQIVGVPAWVQNGLFALLSKI
ncbi:MAG: cupin domain-containing protein [Chloroflexota bacterium]